MLKHLKVIAIVLATSSVVSLAHADSTLAYELTATDGSKTQHSIAISGRWLRLESKPKGKYDYTVMDTGRMLMFEVDNKKKSFQVTRMGRLYWPVTVLNNPSFTPIAKKQMVSGVRCQAVQEMAIDKKDKKSMTEHCMSAGGPLGLNAREMITLSRLFMSARRIGLAWPGVATPDERQVSLLSQNPDGRRQEFKSVSHGRIDKTLLKIPTTYKRLAPDLPPVKNDKKAQQKAAEKPPTADQRQQPKPDLKPTPENGESSGS
ncbi:MAG: hypothetical protein GQ529_01395 [Methyloprofundus sp.]|nr:hypothetical protein [Methyloprofundus sp.]